eukprot:4542035-Alexandrium_andersonii.AAC.1
MRCALRLRARAVGTVVAPAGVIGVLASNRPDGDEPSAPLAVPPPPLMADGVGLGRGGDGRGNWW